MTYKSSWDAVTTDSAGAALPAGTVLEYVYNDSWGNAYTGPMLETPDFADPPDGTNISASLIARSLGFVDSDPGAAMLFVNRPPVWTPIPDQTVAVDGSITLDLASYVSDRGEPLASYTAFSTDSEISVSRSGSSVTVMGVTETGILRVTVEVSATDVHGASVPSEFEVLVTAMVVVGTIPTVTTASPFIEPGQVRTFDLREYAADMETAEC